ncbi:MAG: hypothetical protein A3A61_02435 [Candidatus Woykebacteria bacterium RIFCSPLOWO2_01_FULL_43_14]|uniref:THIF-type NAD/FAD binding fold domain-containing protein n=2 Tax=Candidatus Woykeibacteriota TaxID=1817899 RepID=A0A1G1WW73_9BACT|nr:MAG: hypothetical protein A3J50_01445 [Candidatus Woykebacteria bacterium RIFCSPHIGHO2_02_FULL_43_16b]OGY31831.1 MAG: hypothetical protein A3A61_02435 [Candidatus Woykebacteria bacterium RIFCSPLOWO2_01_FULL_43_14]
MSNLIKPLILYEGSYTEADLEAFKSKNKIWKIVDIYKKQLFELFETQNPHLRVEPNFQDKVEEFIIDKTRDGDRVLGNWVYFPWNGFLIHILPEEDYERVRTNRNRNLITEDEQRKLKDFEVGVVGLSVGNNVAVGLAYCGISQTIKLAEYDTLRTSNLNRLRAPLMSMGSPKINLAAQQIYEISPYSKVELFSHGLKKDTLDAFFTESPKIRLVFDEIDDFEMKIRIRHKARELRVPVIMLTNLGDSFLVDVERYDQDPQLEIFNGLLGNVPEEVLKVSITEKDKVKYAIQFVGLDNVPTRALGSLLEINRTIVSRPQLYSTVTISGGVGAYLVRKIAMGENVKSGRRRVSLNEVFDLTEDTSQRTSFIEKIKGVLGA